MRQIKLSCLSVSLFPNIIKGDMTIREYAKLCKSLKLDAFDLAMILIKNHTPKYLNQLKNDIADEGIPLAMITTYPDFTHPDDLYRQRELDFLIADIAIASALSAKFLRITAGQAHPETSESEGIQWVVENFQKAAPIGDKYGIQLLFENHSKPGVWDLMDFSNQPHIFLEIASQIKDTSIGINFDTANVLVSGNVTTMQVLDKVIDRVKTIHVADTGTLGKLDPVALGSGIVPFSEIFGYLKIKKFEGWLCLEEFGNNGTEGVKDAVHFVRQTWKKA